MALEGAQERGRAGDPRVILDCLPDRWGLVDADATAAYLANVLEELVGPWDELPQEALVPEQRACRHDGDRASCGTYGHPTAYICLECNTTVMGPTAAELARG